MHKKFTVWALKKYNGLPIHYLCLPLYFLKAYLMNIKYTKIIKSIKFIKNILF
jgi:hypothetical protein